MAEAAVEVGPALFFSLLVITLSFLPVFTLEAQEGRLFSPLAFTKTYAMAAAAGLSVTLVPVLMGYLIRGRIPKETSNPINRAPDRAVSARARGRAAVSEGHAGHRRGRPGHHGHSGAAARRRVHAGARRGRPAVHAVGAARACRSSKAAELLQQTDRLIKTVPEVERVFGKAGRADTATDPAPLEMFETTIQFKPRDQWRAGMTPDKLVEELDRAS